MKKGKLSYLLISGGKYNHYIANKQHYANKINEQCEILTFIFT